MTHEFRLADIGEGLEEAEIITWLVAVGDHVERDQPLIEVMTDKSNAELPAPIAGTVVELGGAIGDMISVGELIAVIDETDAAVTPAIAAPPVTPPVVAPPVVAPPVVAPPVVGSPAASTPAPTPAELSDTEDVAAVVRPKAAPSTRRAARERGVDLTQIIGSGPGGRILLADLDQDPAPLTPAAAPVAALTMDPLPTPDPAPVAPAPRDPAPVEPAPTQSLDEAQAPGTVPLRGVRRVVAQNMTRSWSDIPHIHAFDHVDAEPLLDLRARLRALDRPAYEPLTPLSFFVAAVAKALRDHPEANASIDMAEETITYHGDVNVGIAVASKQGLVVPVLRAADRLDFETLSLTLSQLIRGARDGTLSREHFLGGTVTITNFGSLGGEQAAPLIRPPESMIVGFGSIKARPFVIEDQLTARKTMHIVAGADHRLLDGDVTTAVLTDVAASLVDPLRLVL